MISIMIPTRGRLEMIDACVRSILDTANDPTIVEIVVYTDDDDSSYDDWNFPENVKIIQGPRKKLSAYFSMEGCTGDIFLMCNDDVRFRTQDWDIKVLEVFLRSPDKIIAVYGDDGNPNETTNAPFCFIHKNWVNVTGHLVPPYFSNNFLDTWVNDIADMLGRKVRISIVTEHIHPDFGKREKDQTDHDKWEKHWSENMPQKYIDTLPEREEEAVKLKKFIEEFK